MQLHHDIKGRSSTFSNKQVVFDWFENRKLSLKFENLPRTWNSFQWLLCIVINKGRRRKICEKISYGQSNGKYLF